MVAEEGIEPPTRGLDLNCSNQLKLLSPHLPHFLLLLPPKRYF